MSAMLREREREVSDGLAGSLVGSLAVSRAGLKQTHSCTVQHSNQEFSNNGTNFQEIYPHQVRDLHTDTVIDGIHSRGLRVT